MYVRRFPSSFDRKLATITCTTLLGCCTRGIPSYNTEILRVEQHKSQHLQLFESLKTYQNIRYRRAETFFCSLHPPTRVDVATSAIPVRFQFLLRGIATRVEGWRGGFDEAAKSLIRFLQSFSWKQTSDKLLPLTCLAKLILLIPALFPML